MLNFARRRIIGLLGALLMLGISGCSAIRLAYSNGPQMAWWWLDGYVEFSREESTKAKAALDRWFDWHRASQLTEYSSLLGQAQAQVMQPLTPALACRWQARLRVGIEPALRRAADEFADLVPGLGEAQFKALEQRYAKNNAKLREDHLQEDRSERQKAAFKRTLERGEMIYGELSDAQQKQLQAGLAASPFDPQAWLREQQRRQKDVLQTLRRLVAEKSSKDERVNALRALAKRTEVSPDPVYQDYQRRLTDYNCQLVAQLHNTTSTAQREFARDKFKGWESDLRWLVANPSSASKLSGFANPQ